MPDLLGSAHCVAGNPPGPVSLTGLGQRFCQLRHNPRTLPGVLDPLGHSEDLIGQTRPSQHTRHPRQNPRTQPGGLDPLGHIHCVLSNPPGPVSLTHPDQRIRHPRQSLRTQPGVLDPLGNLFSKKKHLEHISTLTQVVNSFNKRAQPNEILFHSR